MAPRQSEVMRVRMVVTDDFEQSELTTRDRRSKKPALRRLSSRPHLFSDYQGSRTAKAA
jgi:hypothetical protein